MKPLAFLFTFLCLFATTSLFAQNPKQIEADLLKSFSRIEYWSGQRGTDTSGAWIDSLETANDRFGKKLQAIAIKFPATINQQFDSLDKNGPIILSSDDGALRIYTWDTETGGTMHNFENVLQYRSGSNTYAILDTGSDVKEVYVYTYRSLGTLKISNNTYYLATFYGQFSNKDLGRGIRIFTISNGKLNDAKLIKTQSGLHSKLHYEYDYFSVSQNDPNDDIVYDPIKKTISFPVVEDGGKVTDKRIVYKFTGQYFERGKY